MSLGLHIYGQRVALRELPPEDEMVGSIIIPNSAQERPDQGVVVGVGDGFTDSEPCPVRVGDRVIFGQYAGTGVRVGGQDLLLLEATDMLAVVAGD